MYFTLSLLSVFIYQTIRGDHTPMKYCRSVMVIKQKYRNNRLPLLFCPMQASMQKWGVLWDSMVHVFHTCFVCIHIVHVLYMYVHMTSIKIVLIMYKVYKCTHLESQHVHVCLHVAMYINVRVQELMYAFLHWLYHYFRSFCYSW